MTEEEIILEAKELKDKTTSAIIAFLNTKGIDVTNLPPEQRRKLILQYAKTDEFKEWLMTNGSKFQESFDVGEEYIDFIIENLDIIIEEIVMEEKENEQIEEQTEEAQFTSFSQYLTENAIKEKSMQIVYNYVMENLDELTEMASQGDENAIDLLMHANDIEENFIGE